MRAQLSAVVVGLLRKEAAAHREAVAGVTVRERQSPPEVGRVLLVEELALSEVRRERRHDREHALLLHEPARLGECGRRVGLVVGELGEVDLAATGQLAVAVCTGESGLRADCAVSELSREAETGHLDRGIGDSTRVALRARVGRVRAVPRSSIPTAPANNNGAHFLAHLEPPQKSLHSDAIQWYGSTYHDAQSEIFFTGHAVARRTALP